DRWSRHSCSSPCCIPQRTVCVRTLPVVGSPLRPLPHSGCGYRAVAGAARVDAADEDASAWEYRVVFYSVEEGSRYRRPACDRGCRRRPPHWPVGPERFGSCIDIQYILKFRICVTKIT